MASEELSSLLEAILSHVGEAQITVFGDFSLDAYWSLDEGVEEHSVETGLAVWKVSQERYSLGGAGNIIANLADMGVRSIRAVGLVGADVFGGELLRQLTVRGVDTKGMLISKNWQTMVYAKPYRGGVEGNRLDFGALNTLSSNMIAALMNALDCAASTSNVVILNEQIPAGVSPVEVVDQINRVIHAHPHARFIVDSRHRARLYSGAILKLNLREACGFLEEPWDGGAVSDSQARSYAQRVFQKTGEPVFLTRGENGMLVVVEDGIYEVPGIQILGRTDPVGAGDAVVSTLATVLATGGDIRVAATLANVVASITVRKLQTTGTANPDEIRRAVADLDYTYRPELANGQSKAQYLDGAEIEVISGIAADVQIKYAVFDHDGTLSTLREGWEQIMHSMMVQAVLGTRYDHADQSLLRKVADSVRHVIDVTTGMPTLVQMRELVQLIRQFGFVPHREVLDEQAYWLDYSNQLSKMVHQRVCKLERGELAPEDFQIKNAVGFLRALRERGIEIFLASGTDKANVIAEATVLGYASLFEGRIFGAHATEQTDAKKIVLDQIIERHGACGAEIATFGDGPAEIRETRRRGGISVGVASDRGSSFRVEYRQAIAPYPRRS